MRYWPARRLWRVEAVRFGDGTPVVKACADAHQALIAAANCQGTGLLRNTRVVAPNGDVFEVVFAPKGGGCRLVMVDQP
mgnify:CR=1 FL=1